MTKYRTHNCNELNLTHKGNQIILSGWINKKRDHGNLLFIDLRDNYGIFSSIEVYPVIPRGLILLRLIPTASHTIKDTEITLEAFSSIREKLNNGTYKTMSEAIPAL